MFVVHSLPVAIAFCAITMLGWGSWANTQKLAGKAKWPFELFYWDYAIGVLLFSLVFAHTLGSWGEAGVAARENLHGASMQFVAPALISGAIFNLSNILLVVGIDAAGLAVAFPVGVGLALVIGTVESYIEAPKGNPLPLFAGVGLIVFAMILSAVAHGRLPHGSGKRPLRGLVYSAVAGCIMGFFYPELMRSISPNFNRRPSWLECSLLMWRWSVSASACWEAILCGIRFSCGRARSLTAITSAAARGCTPSGYSAE